MISTYSRSSPFRAPRQGFSLIEVAIALVIFVIGALAIIRIFPGALSVIGNNGDQQIATNLNRDVSTRMKSENSIPYATFNVRVNADANKTLSWTTADNTDHTADYENIDASVIGVPRFNASLPTPEDINTGTNNSALSRFRGIIGEQGAVFKIGSDFYTTTQFPISLEKINGGTTDTLLAPTISQEYTVQNARIDKTGNVTFDNAITLTSDGKEYRLDDTSLEATTAKIPERNSVPKNSMLYVSYRYYDSATPNKIWGVQEAAIPVTADLKLTVGSANVSPPTTTRGAVGTSGIIVEAIDVHVKRYAGTGSFTGADLVAQTTSARCGLVKLPALIATDTVSIDYVADWSWLLQKGTPLLATDQAPTATLPTGRFYKQIALGAPFIEDQTPVGIYSLLLEPGATPPLYTSRFGTDNPNPDPATDALAAPTEDQLRAGKVTFSVADSESKARVAYRTRDNWVQQLSVAANSYKPFVAGQAERWRDYYLGADNYLYFHAGEAGKTISLSYSYNDVTDGPAAPTALPDKFIVNRPYAIDDQLITAPSAVVSSGFASATDQVARVKLQTAKGEDFPAPKNTATINLTSIQAVKGTSVTVRTAYINGSKYAQTLLTTNRGAN